MSCFTAFPRKGLQTLFVLVNNGADSFLLRFFLVLNGAQSRMEDAIVIGRDCIKLNARSCKWLLQTWLEIEFLLDVIGW